MEHNKKHRLYLQGRWDGISLGIIFGALLSLICVLLIIKLYGY